MTMHTPMTAGRRTPPCPGPMMVAPMSAIDFDQAVEAHRRELHVHCYRMVGSYTDAEDLVQETLLRAWRNQGTFETGTNLRAWLYRIATNVCIDTIRARRRQIPAGGELAEVTWLEPYPDVALDQIATTDDAPDSVAVGRETMELAFIAAIQALPPRQRAVLVLSTGPSWTPSEIASALGMTPAAVNSALQRAREALRRRLPEDRGNWRSPELSDDERAVLRRFIEIHELGDAAGAAALMREDLVATMPPEPMSHHGRAPMLRNIEIAFGPNGMGHWHAVPVLANRQPAAACYVRRPDEQTFEAFKLDVLTVVDGQVAATVTFDAARFGDFGLPHVWSDDLRDATAHVLEHGDNR
jgi:RNA polymerase sigma-70 factor (TIGR02960 family)